MKKNIITCSCTLLSGVFSVVYAQTEIEIDSKKIIEKGASFHDEKKYEEAIAEYKKVNKNDTNYVLSLVELAYTYESSNKDSLAVLTCNEILQTPSPYTVKALLYKAYAFDHQKKYEESSKCYEEGINKYPLNNLFYYDYGRLKYNQKKYKEAHDLFVKSIMYNPYHALSHLMMGNLAVKQGKLIPAILAFQFYLLIDNSSDRANGVVTELEKLVKIEDEFKDAEKVEELSEQDDFSELESLVKSKVALGSKYKSQAKLNFNITKQLQLISEKIVVNKEDKGFYMQFYAPIIAEQYKLDFFEVYSYSILGGLNNEDVDKWLKKNKKVSDEFGSWINKYIGENFATFETVLNNKNIKARHWYNSSNKISSVGNVDAAGGNIGYWNYYYSNGILQAEGGFDDKNQRDGVWKFYDQNQTLKDVERYSHGKLSGKAEGYYSNGSIKANYNYVNGLLDGLQIIYYPTGVKKNEYEYKAGEEIKQRNFYKTGKLEYEVTVANKKYEGDVTKYYKNGHIKEKSFFKEGNREGKYESYYNVSEKQLQSEGIYEKGEVVGEWKSYHQNGKLEETGMSDKE